MLWEHVWWSSVLSQASRKEREDHDKILASGCLRVGFWIMRKNELDNHGEEQRWTVDLPWRGEHGSDNGHFVERRSMLQAWTVAQVQASGAHFLHTLHSDVNNLAQDLCMLDFFSHHLGHRYFYRGALCHMISNQFFFFNQLPLFFFFMALYVCLSIKWHAPSGWGPGWLWLLLFL